MSVLVCDLCPKQCRIAPGQSGECRIRVNLDGKLLAVTHGRPCSVHIDPIEKKPLYHFLPGTPIFSLATVGCNLHCKNCQNHTISQANPEEEPAYHFPPERVVSVAKREGCVSVAYTYSDPVVFYEYSLETSELAREAGLRNVLVTAGYLNPDPLRRLYRVTDAANIDLKFFEDRLYREVAQATLEPVLTALVLAKEEGVWLEVTNLVIPTLSDDMKMIARMCGWIRENLGADTPIHFSRFFPHYKLENLPPTPAATLREACEVARDAGLEYVYVGNLPGTGAESTTCPGCGETLIHRIGYRIGRPRMQNGACESCGRTIPGVWR
ncbi:MAG: AmmeMemoRadiSam system radical SAM enzyme [Planctomycetota bacterium]